MIPNTPTKRWTEEIKALLDRLRQTDLGFPQGDNMIRSPSHAPGLARIFSGFPAKVRDQVSEFYRCCDGLSWPDVWNGIFIESSARLLTVGERGEPNKLFIQGHGELAEIVVVGSDGGGGRFCIDKATGRVLHVRGGLLLERRLEAESSQISTVADEFSEFLNRLKEDLRAFIADDREQHYVV